MEKKTILLASAAAIIAAGGAWAQSGQDNFYQDILISDEIKQQDAADSAQKQAAQILQEDNTSVQSEAEPLNVRSNSVQNAAAAYGTAPFGLTWGISKDEAEQMGFYIYWLRLITCRNGLKLLQQGPMITPSYVSLCNLIFLLVLVCLG